MLHILIYSEMSLRPSECWLQHFYKSLYKDTKIRFCRNSVFTAPKITYVNHVTPCQHNFGVYFLYNSVGFSIEYSIRNLPNLLNFYWTFAYSFLQNSIVSSTGVLPIILSRIVL